jgi:hypothetical protein
MYKDKDGIFQACIVNSVDVSTLRVGSEFELEDAALSSATSYGVDWSVVFPKNIVIDASSIQEIMYRHGIVSLEDLKRNPIAVNNAILELVRRTAANIYKIVKEQMEDYNDNSV